jgi:predicted outer membrane repeat protein
MRRLFRLSLFVALLGAMALSVSNAQKPQATVSGRVGQDEVRIFVKDSVYIIDRQYTIAGTLIIEPGTEVHFYPNGRIIDSVGGRIIADGMANAWYNQNPYRANGTRINPIAPNSGFSGYADLDYFTYTGYYDEDGDGNDELQRAVYVDTERDLTVHENKYNYVFNVMLDKENRSVHNLRYDGGEGMPNPEYAEIISFEEAIMFYAARLNIDPDLDNRININPWRRLNDRDVNVEPEQIKFIGQPFNVSREWGHIIVLPGARAAFFRHCSFDGFRKDTTVDRIPLYADAPAGTDLNMLNTAMRHYTNGSGGAISTFSSRTWLIDVEFTNNMARYRGGALQILQAPQVFPKPYPVEEIGFYHPDKNPNITDMFGHYSNSHHHQFDGVPRIDLLDEAWDEPMTDEMRQAYDDARIAVYLGRMRNMTFEGNSVDLSNVKSKMMNGVPFVYHDYDEPAHFPQEYGNWAMGGAIFIEGSPAAEDSKIEVGFGVNHSINVYTDREDLDAGTIYFPEEDTFVANGNSANNYQGSMNSYGARGGAIYVGKYTSLIVSGEFTSNETYAKFLQNPENGSNSGYYSMGGAIFTENTFGRLQVRGGPERDLFDNNTIFRNNTAGAGGAIFVDGNTDPHPSPLIGGSDHTANTRDYGYGILFENNYASSFGGALFTKRNFSIHGAGGVIDNALLGYGGFYPVKFYNNAAGFAGGAVHVSIPNAIPPLPAFQREIQLVRAEFVGNVVGENVLDISIPDIRGGGAFYTLNGDLNVVKGVEFRANKVYNGNGGAVAMIHPQTSSKRYFLSDLDYVHFNWETRVADGFYSVNGPFIFDDEYEFPADQRMLTRFLDNEIELDPEVLEAQSGTGTTQIGQGTVGQSAQLLATTWLDQNTGFAVGLNGTIIRLTNGGVNWEYMNWNFQYRLNDIYFPTYNVGIIVGDRGIVLRTTNNGQSWYEVRPPVETLSLNAVHFVGSTIGYAVGDNGRVLKTIDAGETWFDPVVQSATISDLYGIYFMDSNFGFAVGERGTVIYTFNGGENWEVMNVNTFADLNDIYFTDMMNGYIVGDFGVILHTADGGGAWSEKEVVMNESFNSVHFTDVAEGYAVGDFGVIYKLTLDNGDLNVEPLASNTSYSLSDVFFPGNSTGFAVGDYGMMIGTNDGGETWFDVIPADLSVVDVVRYHPEIRLPENGIGLGGAIYILDSVTTNRIGRMDTVAFNRVRIQNNKSYTGAAIYSDNYDLKLLFDRSLITGNEAYSEIGLEQNVIEGPAVKEQGSDDITVNPASSDLAGAIIYGEIQGPLPSFMYSEAANSIYNNHARFLIRLPDAPNTKGVLAGTTGIGFGGTDTLRGNYWGRTEADVNLRIENFQGYQGGIQPTFFVDVDNERHLDYVFFEYDAQADAPNLQGPFENFGTKQSFDDFMRPYEQIIGFSYQPIPLTNGDDQNTVGDGSIPDKVMMSGWCYDIYDKHTDIKTADFANRRLSPIEDFAVGIPPMVRRFEDETQPSFGKYVKRWVRDPLQATDGIYRRSPEGMDCKRRW